VTSHLRPPMRKTTRIFSTNLILQPSDNPNIDYVICAHILFRKMFRAKYYNCILEFLFHDIIVLYFFYRIHLSRIVRVIIDKAASIIVINTMCDSCFNYYSNRRKTEKLYSCTKITLQLYRYVSTCIILRRQLTPASRIVLG